MVVVCSALVEAMEERKRRRKKRKAEGKQPFSVSVCRDVPGKQDC